MYRFSFDKNTTKLDFKILQLFKILAPKAFVIKRILRTTEKFLQSKYLRLFIISL